MSGISVKLPLTRDPSLGYTNIKSYKELYEQNMKMVLLTSPGERIMDISFGVGLRQYLFRNKDIILEQEIKNNIIRQINTYVKEIEVVSVKIYGIEEESETPYISVNISYRIPFLSENQQFDLKVTER